MKKIILAMVFVFALSSIGFASPLMNYDKGNASIDINYRPSLDVDGTAGVNNLPDEVKEHLPNLSKSSMDGTAYDWGVTLGLGKDFAVQYRQFNPDFDIFRYNQPTEPRDMYKTTQQGDIKLPVDSASVDGKIKSEEFNILYKLNKNVAAFTGVVRAQPSVKLSINNSDPVISGSTAIEGDYKNMWQFGLVGSTKVFDKTNAYGVVSVGKDYRNWELGLSYELDKDIELNLNYRDAKFDKLPLVKIAVEEKSYDIDAKDITAKGFGFGLTVKF